MQSVMLSLSRFLNGIDAIIFLLSQHDREHIVACVMPLTMIFYFPACVSVQVPLVNQSHLPSYPCIQWARVPVCPCKLQHGDFHGPWGFSTR